MTLEELASATPFARPLAVPPWSLGCFRRRCITFATGAEDADTRVVWIQSHALTGDLRIPARRPDMRHRSSIADCTRDELIALGQAEGGIADTSFDHDRGLMRWANWRSFQPYDKYPEPGMLRRIGACMIEFAPSGIYVEDWRAQQGVDGLLVGLRLVSEEGTDGIARERGGGLVIAGSHAIIVLARRTPLPASAPVHQQLAAARDPHAFASLAFDCECSYMRFQRERGAWIVELSTNPFREAQVALLDDGFMPGPERDLITQDTIDHGQRIHRLWRIDTLLRGQALPVETETTREGLAWFEREISPLSLSGQ